MKAGLSEALEPQIINFHFNSWGFATPNPHFTCPREASSKRQDAETRWNETGEEEEGAEEGAIESEDD